MTILKLFEFISLGRKRDTQKGTGDAAGAAEGLHGCGTGTWAGAVPPGSAHPECRMGARARIRTRSPSVPSVGVYLTWSRYS